MKGSESAPKGDLAALAERLIDRKTLGRGEKSQDGEKERNSERRQNQLLRVPAAGYQILNECRVLTFSLEGRQEILVAGEHVEKRRQRRHHRFDREQREKPRNDVSCVHAQGKKSRLASQTKTAGKDST